MDTTDEYIKMCQTAPEVQPHDLEFLNGDCIYYQGKWGMYFKERFYNEHVFNDGSLINYELNPFRLHTQDQLQDMVDYNCLASKCVEFYCFITGRERGGQFHNFVSLEQLWLAFVMKEKFNKVWKNNKWRKGNKRAE